MDIQVWFQRKNDISRRRFLERHITVLGTLPADRLVLYLCDLQEISARRIQTAWRGYKGRKKFAQIRDQLKREKAAVTIQRRVRHWLHTKARRQESNRPKPCQQMNRINEERLQHLQQEISRWQDNHRVKFQGMKHLTESHLQVQNRLASFYWRVSEANNRHEQTEMRCAQLEAISMLMNDLPTLAQSEDVDVSWYHCLSLPLATAARLAHKQQIHSLNAPWWCKLKS